MPKISKHNGPSHKGEPRPPSPVVEPVRVEVRIDLNPDADEVQTLRDYIRKQAAKNERALAVIEPADETEGGEESSPGSSSSASTPKQPTNSEPSKPARRKPARTMASRSGQDQTGSSSVPLMVGDPTAPTSATEPEQAE